MCAFRIHSDRVVVLFADALSWAAATDLVDIVGQKHEIGPLLERFVPARAQYLRSAEADLSLMSGPRGRFDADLAAGRWLWGCPTRAPRGPHPVRHSVLSGAVTVDDSLLHAIALLLFGRTVLELLLLAHAALLSESFRPNCHERS